MGTESSAACRSALVPAYVPPDAMARLADRPATRRVAIVNPANGPGSEARPSLRRAIDALRRSGTRVLGYVHTSYGSRDAALVTADVGRWRAWYGVDGVFLDESAESEDLLAHYASLIRAARAAGMDLVVLNPGLVPARGYFEIADVVVTFEGPYRAYAAAVRRMPDWLRDLPPRRSANLIHGASRAQAMQAVAAAPAGWFFATSGAMPNPWSPLPAYLADLEAELETCR
jgi:Spherulation-specific family 4